MAEERIESEKIRSSGKVLLLRTSLSMTRAPEISVCLWRTWISLFFGESSWGTACSGHFGLFWFFWSPYPPLSWCWFLLHLQVSSEPREVFSQSNNSFGSDHRLDSSFSSRESRSRTRRKLCFHSIIIWELGAILWRDRPPEGPKHLSQYLKKLSVFPVHTVPLLFVKENFDKTEESKVSVRVFLQTSILRYLLAPLVRSHPVLQAGSHGGENTARNLFELPRGGQSSAADWVLLRLDLWFKGGRVGESLVSIAVPLSLNSFIQSFDMPEFPSPNHFRIHACPLWRTVQMRPSGKIATTKVFLDRFKLYSNLVLPECHQTRLTLTSSLLFSILQVPNSLKDNSMFPILLYELPPTLRTWFCSTETVSCGTWAGIGGFSDALMPIILSCFFSPLESSVAFNWTSQVELGPFSELERQHSRFHLH